MQQFFLSVQWSRARAIVPWMMTTGHRCVQMAQLGTCRALKATLVRSVDCVCHPALASALDITPGEVRAALVLRAAAGNIYC